MKPQLEEVHVLCAASGIVAAIFEDRKDALRAKKKERKRDPRCYLERGAVLPAGTVWGSATSRVRFRVTASKGTSLTGRVL